MDYNTLLDLGTDLGYYLAMSGAETFRVEESIVLVLKAYGVEAEAFAIPNCLTVSIQTAEGKSMTRMRRIGFHGNDLDGVERFSNLSRRICSEKPDPAIAQQLLHETGKSLKHHSVPIYLIGHFLGALGFAIFFGSGIVDALWAGLLGTLIGLVSLLMNKLHVNLFFSTIISAFIMALPAYILSDIGIIANADAVIIGTLMILVPGLLFTNAMRDIIYGDTNSGVNRIVQVFLVAMAIALGTAAAWQLVGFFGQPPASIAPASNGAVVQLIATFIGCIGFAILFNVHGPGMLLCALGGIIAWTTYLIATAVSGSDLAGYLWAAAMSSFYAEIMARLRKYPAISYLVISTFPLLPGASIYYTMVYVLRSEMEQFSNTGLHTAAIAGALAVGILMVSTIFRIWATWKRTRISK